MNILLINHYAGSPKHGMEYRPFYLSREWVKQGHHVTIVGASFSHVRSSSPVVIGSFAQETIEGITYLWLKTPAYAGNGIRRVVNMLAFVFQLFKMTRFFCDNVRPDVVIASSTYPLDVFPAKRIAAIARANFLYEVHDLWPLSPIELGGMSKFHPFMMLLQWGENFGYRNADKVVSMLPKADSHMREHGMEADKFVYIPNGIVAEEWNNASQVIPEIHQQLLTQLRNENHFIVMYAGAHGLANALDTVLEAAEKMREDRVSFVLVGEGPEKQVLQKRAVQSGLSNVHFLPPVPRNNIPELLSHADALNIGLKAEPLFRFGVSPNKLMDYMMAGKPIIHAIEAGNDLVAESNCGISIRAESSSELCKAIVRMMEFSISARELMGSNGRRYVLAHHDYKILAQQFAEMLLDLRGVRAKRRETYQPALTQEVAEGV